MFDAFLPDRLAADQNAEERHRARILVIVCMVLVPALSVRLVLYIVGGAPLEALRPFLACLGCLMVLAMLKRGRSLNLSVQTLCGILYLAGCSLAFSRGPNSSSALLAMSGIALLSMFCAGRRSGVWWAGLHTVVVLGFGVYRHTQPELPDVLPMAARPMMESAGGVGFLIVLIFLGYAFERSRELESGNRERAEHEETRAKAEAALLRVDRYLVLGQLTATLTHEVNNPLQILSSNLEEITRPDANTSPADRKEMLSDMHHAVASIRRIMSDLSDYIRTPSEDSDLVPLSNLLDTALHMAGARLRRVATVERDFADETLLVELPKVPIQQIMLNLILNAADAVGESPKGAGTIRVEMHRLNEFWARVVVSDDGVGMTESVRKRALEPFFSTKENSGGGGLGLSASKAILEELGGRFYMESTPHQGTRVTVDLPMIKREAYATTPVRCVALAELTRLRILLIDDDVAVGKSLRLLLRDHDVVFAQGGIAALDVLKQDTAFDAVVLDVSMPEMDGMETYARILNAWPRLAGRVVVLTGGANNRRLREFVQSTELPLLTKPVDEADCARALQLVVTGRVDPEAAGDQPLGLKKLANLSM